MKLRVRFKLSKDKQAILLCIYADKGNGGFHGPIFDDNSFEGIPIPGNPPGWEYDDIIGVHNRPLSDFVPNRILKKNYIAHFDPDPINLTYGDKFNYDMSGKVPNKLKKLHKGDLILWAARLHPYNGKKYLENAKSLIYLIGWLKINYILDFTDPKSYEKIEWNPLDNVHLLECGGNLELLKIEKHIIAYGQEEIGGQLEKAILLTKPYEKPKGYPIIAKYENLFLGASYLSYIGHYNLNYNQAWNLIKDKPIKNPSLK
jgi:hypothetical protein